MEGSRPSRFISTARLLSIIGLALSAVALGGWVLDVGGLRSIVPGESETKVNTAICLLLLGAALMALAYDRFPRARRAAGGLAAVIGLLALIENAGGGDFGLNELVFEDRADAGTGAPGLMAASSGLAFTLLGMALALPPSRAERSMASEALALAAALIGITAIGRFATGDFEPGQAPWLTEMAMPTAIATISIGVGVLLVTPERGLAAVLASDSAGGEVVRRLLPAAVLIPLALAVAVAIGQNAGLWDESIEALLLISALVVLLGAVALVAGRAAERSDRELRSVRDRFQELLEFAPDAVVGVAPDGGIRFFNAGAVSLFGYTRDELINRPVEQLVPETLRGVHVGHREAYMAAPRARPMGAGLDLLAQRRDGSRFACEVSLSWIQWGEEKLALAAVRDVSVQRDADAELRAAKQELERSNEALQRFAYSASHDLREPLLVIDGFISLLATRLSGRLDEEEARYLANIESAVGRMQTLIEALLAYSRVGQRGENLERVDASEVAREALEGLTGMQADLPASVEVDELPELVAERVGLLQVFQNLISNALKFGGEELTRVEVSAQRLGAAWLFEVADDGPGVPEEQREEVFEMFRRSHDRSVEGAGIGLATCWRIVARHGGRLWVEDSALGGAAFRFTVPDQEPAAE